MDCLHKTYQFYKLIVAILLILDIIFHVFQTQQYFISSPTLHYYHEANLNLSERIHEFCEQINQARFNISLANEKQKNTYEEWNVMCDSDFTVKVETPKEYIEVVSRFSF